MIILFGTMLFPRHTSLPLNRQLIFMAEDLAFCTRFRYHKHKLILVLAAMRHHRDRLQAQGHCVRYWELSEDTQNLSYEEKIVETLRVSPSREIHTYEPDNSAQKDWLTDFCDRHQIQLILHESPLFLTSHQQFQDYRDRYQRFFMADFYKMQRRRLDVLMTDTQNPVGEQWSFDEQNREKLPKELSLPGIKSPQPTSHIKAVSRWVDSHCAHHPGTVEDFWLPVTREDAIDWMHQFFQERFAQFGPYEDALSDRDPFLFHSVLSPLINIGLLIPEEVLEQAIHYSQSYDIPLNSLEGFVRQLIGWREYIRGVYHEIGAKQRQSNALNHSRKLSQSWYEGNTGLVPVDHVIQRLKHRGWCHHIERLMVMSNAMLLCEIDPKEVYRWFMEFFVDSADWVMVPNVYGMGQFADGGLMMTKPYISGSNYLRKMGSYPTGNWCDIWDGLYWRFIDRHRDLVQKNPRMSMMVSTLSRMKPEKRDRLFLAADAFMNQHTFVK